LQYLCAVISYLIPNCCLIKKAAIGNINCAPFIWGIPVISLCAGHILGEML
jgi:hypothetical protein